MSKSLAALLVLVFSASFSYVGAGPACADDGTKVVVRFVEGDEKTLCGDSSAGENSVDLLRSTGLEVQTKDFGGGLGAAVCKIQGQGNDRGDCPGVDGHWHFWVFREGSWEESQVGASQHAPTPGDVEGWTWEADADSDPPGKPGQDCTEAASAGSRRRSALGWQSAAALAAIVLIGFLVRRRQA